MDAEDPKGGSYSGRKQTRFWERVKIGPPRGSFSTELQMKILSEMESNWDWPPLVIPSIRWWYSSKEFFTWNPPWMNFNRSECLTDLSRNTAYAQITRLRVKLLFHANELFREVCRAMATPTFLIEEILFKSIRGERDMTYGNTEGKFTVVGFSSLLLENLSRSL